MESAHSSLVTTCQSFQHGPSESYGKVTLKRSICVRGANAVIIITLRIHYYTHQCLYFPSYVASRIMRNASQVWISYISLQLKQKKNVHIVLQYGTSYIGQESKK
jgi:hypothetical protein